MNDETRHGTRRPPALLFVVNAVWFFLSHRLPIAEGAGRAGFSVHVAGGYEQPSEIEQLNRHAIAFHHIPIDRGAGAPHRDLATMARLAFLYRSLRPAIIHHVTSKPIILGSIAAGLVPGQPIVNAVSGLGYVFSSSDIRAKVIRSPLRLAYLLALRRRASYSIFQNVSDREALYGAGRQPPRAVLIRGAGVDLVRFHPLPEPVGPPCVLLPARMLRDKGVVEFCKAAPVTRCSVPKARFVLSGRLDPGNPSGLAKKELEDLCAETGVEWLGEQADMARAMSEATLICLPSYREGLPKALIEACAAGRPIVATDVPGCRDVVTHGVNGLLVPARDPHALAVAIAELLRDPLRRLNFGTKARLRAEQEFDVNQIVSQTVGLYRRIMMNN